MAVQNRITIVDNKGLTLVGKVDLNAPGDFITIEKARCVIRWGTEKHLAQLVEGPRNETRLGYAADAVVLKRNIVVSYLCSPSWDTVIDGENDK